MGMGLGRKADRNKTREAAEITKDANIYVYKTEENKC
jgi:hypothetical protein